MSLVLDASVALAWALPDEDSPYAERVFDTLNNSGGWVPTIWRLEIANGLQLGIRRGRINAAFRDATLDDLGELPIKIDLETAIHAWRATLVFADRFRLSLYDACYLELAQRMNLPLASLDRDLRLAAQALGLELLGA